MNIKLRDYQQECIDILEKKGQGKYLVQMATGLGKTVTFANLKRKGRMLILSHREELVKQPLKYFDCTTGIEMAENTSSNEEIISASIQTMTHRLHKFKPDDFSTIIVDEAHHAAAKSYKEVINHFTPYQLIGFTATPNRADNARLNDVFSEIVFKRDLKWGIKNKYLCDIDCKRVDIGYDLSGVHTKCGDYAPGELSEAMAGTEDAIAEAYENYAKGQTLIFAASVSHANSIAERIDGAQVITGKTKDRESIIKEFTDRKIPCLVNCMVFTEGTDIPLVETVIIARPTQSDSLYTQMVGRGLRLSPGKDKLTLIDCVGVTGKRSLCTAPSLLGIDIDMIPKSKRKYIQGDLFELPDLTARLTDTPASWIKNVETVDLWAKSQDYNLHNINFFQMPDGDLTVSLMNEKITIPCPDEMGNTVGRDGKEYEMQNAIDMVYERLSSEFPDQSFLWNMEEVKRWGNYPASEKQINLIKKKCKKDLDDIDIDSLTKMQASMILNRVINKK